MKQYAVIHIEKGKSNVSSLGKHIDREHSPENANKDLREHNLEIVSHHKDLNGAIEKRIKNGYKGKTAIRRDAVKSLSVVLTGTHETMKDIQNRGDLKAWTKANIDFLEKRYGKENIVSAHLHLDELTPHIHAVVVPLTSDGRLSTKVVLGGPAELRQLQDDYANAMSPFNLTRGERYSRAKHEDVKEYYKRIKEPLEDNFEIKKNILGIKENAEKAVSRYKEEVAIPIFNKLRETEKKAQGKEIINRMLNKQQEENKYLKEQLTQEKELSERRLAIISKFVHGKVSEKERENYLKQFKEKETEQEQIHQHQDKKSVQEQINDKIDQMKM